MAVDIIYEVHGEVRRKATPESEASEPWNEVLCKVNIDDLRDMGLEPDADGVFDADMRGNYLAAAGQRVVDSFNRTRRPHEKERELIRTWVVEREDEPEEEDDEGNDTDRIEPEGYDGDHDD